MAAQTITTSVNHDSASVTGLLDGEAYTINAGILTINGDVRWGQNAAVVGGIAISSTLGGSLIFDGSTVWEISYSASTGNVPTLTTLGNNGVSGGTSNATGELFRVWATGSLTPSAAGGSMPATGWIKLRTKTGTFSSGETVTLPGGATIVIVDAGKRSWIHLVGAELATINVPRLGDWTTTGDWYSLGSTSGSNNQTIQYPVADYCPAIQIETSPGSTTFEWYLNAGARWNTATKYVSTDARGKFFGCTSGGVITLAVSGANECGYLPASGCAIRIPNIILSSSTSANWALNTLSATLSSRWDCTTTSAGVLNISYLSSAAFMSPTSAYSVSISNCAFLDQLYIANIGATTTISNVAVGLNGSLDAYGCQIQSCFGGGTISNVRAVRYTSDGSGYSGFILTDCIGFTCNYVQGEVFGSATAITRGNSGANGISLSRVSDTTLNYPVTIGGRVLVSACTNVKIYNLQFADCHMGTTSSTNAQTGIDISSSSLNCLLDGVTAFAGIANIPPYNYLVGYSTTSNIEFRNIGTTSTPYDLCGITGYVAYGPTSKDIVFRRIYCVNSRTNAINTGNASYGLKLINFQVDYADTQTIANNNATIQGARWSPSPNGQQAVYGRHWEDGFTSATTGYVLIAGNEPLSDTTAQYVITSGGPRYTSTGNIAMPTVGDQVTFYQQYYAIGHTGFADIAPLFTATNPQNFTFSYQIDKNNGTSFGSWKTLAYYISATSGSNGSTTIRVGSTATIRVDDRISGTGVGTGATVASITNTTDFVVTVANSTAVSGLLSFWKEITAETGISASLGFKLNVKATVTTATNNNSFTYLRINTTSDASSQLLQYPLPVESYTLTLTGLQSLSEVRIYKTSDMSDLAGTETVSGIYEYTYEYTTTIPITIVIFALGWQPIRIEYSIGRANASIPIQQTIDRVYLNA